MSTGCQGPYIHGTGGWCGCDCKCCPPPSCTTVLVYFQPCNCPGFACVNLTAPTNGTCSDCASIGLTNAVLSKIDDTIGECIYEQVTTGGPCGTITWRLTINKISGAWTFSVLLDDVIIVNYSASSEQCTLTEVVMSFVDSTGDCIDWPASLSVRLTVDGTCPEPAMAAWSNLQLPSPPAPAPLFNYRLEASEDDSTIMGGPMFTCSVPCDNLAVPVSVGGPTPACAIEILDGVMYVVGNGTVTAPLTVDAGPCGTLDVLINGSPSPVFLNDGDVITITLVGEDGNCCNCRQSGVSCAPAMAMALWRRKVRMGKPILNAKTGKQKVYLDKAELIRRLAARQKKLR